MGSVIFFNHLYACSTVLSNLVDVGSFEQAQADVRVAQTIGSSRPAVAVSAELFFFKNRVEQVARPFRKQKISRTRLVPLSVRDGSGPAS